jgi:hypothetical protein
MDKDEEIAKRVERFKAQERAEKDAKKVLRRTARYVAFLLGFGIGIYTDFTTSGNSILGIIVFPFLLGGAFILPAMLLMFGLGM